MNDIRSITFVKCANLFEYKQKKNTGSGWIITVFCTE